MKDVTIKGTLCGGTGIQILLKPYRIMAVPHLYMQQSAGRRTMLLTAVAGCRTHQNIIRESTTIQKDGGTNFYPNLGAYLRQASTPKRRIS